MTHAGLTGRSSFEGDNPCNAPRVVELGLRAIVGHFVVVGKDWVGVLCSVHHDPAQL